MLMPHSINHGNACFAYFNKIWGIPPDEFIKRKGGINDCASRFARYRKRRDRN